MQGHSEPIQQGKTSCRICQRPSLYHQQACLFSLCYHSHSPCDTVAEVTADGNRDSLPARFQNIEAQRTNNFHQLLQIGLFRLETPPCNFTEMNLLIIAWSSISLKQQTDTILFSHSFVQITLNYSSFTEIWISPTSISILTLIKTFISSFFFSHQRHPK